MLQFKENTIVPIGIIAKASIINGTQTPDLC